jgi:hypothetical protein
LTYSVVQDLAILLHVGHEIPRMLVLTTNLDATTGIANSNDKLQTESSDPTVFITYQSIHASPKTDHDPSKFGAWRESG